MQQPNFSTPADSTLTDFDAGAQTSAAKHGADASEPLAHALARARHALHATPLPAGLQARVMAAVAVKLPPSLDLEPATSPRFALAPHGSGLWAKLRASVRKGAKASGASSSTHSRPVRHGLRAWAASAASMGVALGMVWLLAPASPAPTALSAAPLAEFVALPGSTWAGRAQSAAPSEPVWVMPMDVPRAQLVRYGLPFDPADPTQRVRAQVLVNAQGQALALRIDSPLP